MGVLNCIPTCVMLIGRHIGPKSIMPASPSPLDDTPTATNNYSIYCTCLLDYNHNSLICTYIFLQNHVL